MTVLWSRTRESPISLCWLLALSIGFLWSLVLKTAAAWHSSRSPSTCFSFLVCHSLLSLLSLAFLPSLISLTLPLLSVSLCFCCPFFLPWPLSGILQLFSRLSTAVTTRAACLPLLPSCASASFLCISSSGHSSKDAVQRRWERTIQEVCHWSECCSIRSVLADSKTEPNSSFNRRGCGEVVCPFRAVLQGLCLHQSRIDSCLHRSSLGPWLEVLPFWPEWEQLQDRLDLVQFAKSSLA